MAATIIMPQGGQDIAEGKVLKWHKAEGQPVKKGEVVCEVETEKAAFDVEAPEDGVLLKILAREGEQVAIFSAIGFVGRPGEQLSSPPPARQEPEQQTGGIDLDAIRRRLGKGGDGESPSLRISGRARKAAEERGIDIRKVKGTGPGGRVTESDVVSHAEAGARAAAPVAPAPQAGSVPLSKVRSAIARRMQESKQTVPHFYVTVSVDMTEAVRLREELNRDAPAGTPPVSLNDLLAKATGLALAELRNVNCRLDGERIVYLDDVNLGIAVALEDGLVVPVLAGVDRLGVREIASRTRELVRAAKAGKQPNLTPATFTLSNMGMLGVESFAAIINPPESAILAVGAVVKRVVVDDAGAMRIRDVMSMTLSADHRVLDGATVARFLATLKANLEEPRRLAAPGP